MTARDNAPLGMTGHVLIRDAASKHVLVDTYNAIHLENMSYALAAAMGSLSNGPISSMAFGNGGSTNSAIGSVVYFPPNVTSTSATLYNQTYSKVVNTNSTLNVNVTDNNISVLHTVGNSYSDIQVTATLEYNEPVGQAPYDNVSVLNTGGVNASPYGQFIFDEIGLTSSDGHLLSHVIFHPIQKALNRSIEVIYTIRIVLS